MTFCLGAIVRRHERLWNVQELAAEAAFLVPLAVVCSTGLIAVQTEIAAQPLDHGASSVRPSSSGVYARSPRVCRH